MAHYAMIKVIDLRNNLENTHWRVPKIHKTCGNLLLTRAFLTTQSQSQYKLNVVFMQVAAMPPNGSSLY